MADETTEPTPAPVDDGPVSSVPTPVPPPLPPTPSAIPPTISSEVATVCQKFEARLEACRQGLANPIALVNASWQYFPALGSADQQYLADRVVESFSTLRDRLIKEFISEVQTIINR